MFYNQHVLCSKLILFHGTSTFLGENFIVLKKVDNKMNEQGFFISLFSDIFSQKFEKHFFPRELCSVYSSLRLFTYSCSWFMVSFIPFSLFCCCRESLYSFSCLFEMFSSTISIFFLKSFSRSLLSANFSRKAVISLAFALTHL